MTVVVGNVWQTGHSRQMAPIATHEEIISCALAKLNSRDILTGITLNSSPAGTVVWIRWRRRQETVSHTDKICGISTSECKSVVDSEPKGMRLVCACRRFCS